MSTGGVRDVSISFATTLYIQVVNVATGLLAARLLLAEGRGELAALMLWPGLVAELGCLALSDAMLYRLASGASPARLVCGTMLALTAVLCAVLVPVGFAILPFVMAGHEPDIVAAAWWYMALYLPTYFLSLFAANMFQGQLDLLSWNVVRAIVPTAYLAGIVALGLAAAPAAPEFAAASIASMLASAALGAVLMARRGWFSLRASTQEARALVVYGAKAHAGEVLHSLRQKLDQAVVATMMTASDLGIYAVALTVANGPLILVQTIANIAFPKISAQETQEGKVVVFGRYLRLALVLVAGIDVVLWATNAWIIPLLFGPSFAPAVQVANICLVGLLPFAAKLLCAAALKACDRALAIPRAELWGLVAVAPSLLALVPWLGLAGAAASLVVAQAVTAVLLARRLGRELDMHPLRMMIPNAEDARLLRAALARGLGRG